MFDFDAGKLLIIGVVALMVIGPKDLPRVLRQVGQAVSRLRRMAGEFQGQFMEAMKEAEIQDIRDEVKKLGAHADLNVNFDPARDIQKELTQAITPSAPISIEPALPPTGNFDLPLPPPLPETPESTPAAAGLAPVADGLAVPVDESSGAQIVDRQKRKIVVRRRRPLPGATPTARPALRLRGVRPSHRDVTDQ